MTLMFRGLRVEYTFKVETSSNDGKCIILILVSEFAAICNMESVSPLDYMCVVTLLVVN